MQWYCYWCGGFGDGDGGMWMCVYFIDEVEYGDLCLFVQLFCVVDGLDGDGWVEFEGFGWGVGFQCVDFVVVSFGLGVDGLQQVVVVVVFFVLEVDQVVGGGVVYYLWNQGVQVQYCFFVVGGDEVVEGWSGCCIEFEWELFGCGYEMWSGVVVFFSCFQLFLVVFSFGRVGCLGKVVGFVVN